MLRREGAVAVVGNRVSLGLALCRFNYETRCSSGHSKGIASQNFKDLADFFNHFYLMKRDGAVDSDTSRLQDEYLDLKMEA